MKIRILKNILDNFSAIIRIDLLSKFRCLYLIAVTDSYKSWYSNYIGAFEIFISLN